VEVIHGVRVRDPYRWLEDRTLPETAEWIGEQENRCNAYFDNCGDVASLRKIVERYLDVETVDQPARVGDQYFFRRRSQGQEQGSIYVRHFSTGIERLLVDPSVEGPYVSVGIHRISSDGMLLAYEVRHGGEDQIAIRVVDVRDGKTLEDSLERGFIRGFVFLPGGRGFLYARYVSGDTRNWTIRRHLFGSRAEDPVVFKVPWSPRGRLLLIGDAIHIAALWSYEETGERLSDLYIARQVAQHDWKRVVAKKPMPFAPWLQEGRLFYLSEAHGADAIFEIDFEGQQVKSVADRGIDSVRQLVAVGEHICINRLNESGFQGSCLNVNSGDVRVLSLPLRGTVRFFPQRGQGSSLFVKSESFTRPGTIFEYSPATGAFSVWHEPQERAVDTCSHVTEHWYSSVDRTAVPLTLLSRTSFRQERPQSTIMTTYGGFGVPGTPQYSVLVSVLVDIGFVFALPHVRGGGEFGNAWHDAGRGRNKQVSFDDFIAAAEWLIKEGVTSPQQLAIFGGSNGGLVVGAAITQAPHLFRAALCIAPLLDMVRYEEFDQASKWSVEYGSSENEEEFRVLYSYSPYHAIRDGIDYPAILFVAGDKDERCNPAHVRKMAARMMADANRGNTVIVDYHDQRGHSPVLPLQLRIDALTRRIAFILHELSIEVPTREAV
jgi:prolyl oligopeptidase